MKIISDIIKDIKIYFAWEECYLDKDTDTIIPRTHMTDTMCVFDPNRYKPKMFNEITGKLIDINLRNF